MEHKIFHFSPKGKDSVCWQHSLSATENVKRNFARKGLKRKLVQTNDGVSLGMFRKTWNYWAVNALYILWFSLRVRELWQRATLRLNCCDVHIMILPRSCAFEHVCAILWNLQLYLPWFQYHCSTESSVVSLKCKWPWRRITNTPWLINCLLYLRRLFYAHVSAVASWPVLFTYFH